MAPAPAADADRGGLLLPTGLPQRPAAASAGRRRALPQVAARSNPRFVLTRQDFWESMVGGRDARRGPWPRWPRRRHPHWRLPWHARTPPEATPVRCSIASAG